ncbi:MAG TPA: hypothetical protein VMU11_04325 [Verrucomicrobiae bacterium]|nr:hypothetical protein [Verrucomicrobiae bacterium]
MKRDQWLAFFDAQPGAVQNYLLGQDATDREVQAQTSLAYDNDAWDRVMDVVWELIFLKTSRGEFINRIRSLAGDRKPEIVEKTVLQWVVLPLADLVIWDVEARLMELGVPQSEIQSAPRVSLRPVSYGAAARRIAALAKISLLDEGITARLREILISYIKGVRDAGQVEALIQRPQAEGGLGFAKPQAEEYVRQMQDFLVTTQVMSETDYAEWFQNEQNEAEQEQAQIASTAAKTGDRATEGLIEGQKARTVDPVLDATIDETIKNINLSKPLPEHLQTRLRNLISSRLRDVRNREQVLAVLQREEKVGGMGFEPAEAERIETVIDAVYKDKRTAIEDEAKQKIILVQEEQKKRMEERRQRESQEHAEWYRQKVLSTKGDEALRQIIAEGGRKAPMPAGAPRPTVDGISGPTMLMDLASELKQMDIEAYRRLSRDPKQAEQRVIEKLETLKRESFDRWTEGVEAWRSSALQKQYLKLITESFASGKPVSELIEEKRKTDPSLPTAEELASIIELNGKIQF